MWNPAVMKRALRRRLGNKQGHSGNKNADTLVHQLDPSFIFLQHRMVTKKRNVAGCSVPIGRSMTQHRKT